MPGSPDTRRRAAFSPRPGIHLGFAFGLAVGLSGAVGSPAGADALDLGLSVETHQVGISLTLPEDWQAGVAFPQSREFWTEAEGGQAITFRVGNDARRLFASDAPLFRNEQVEVMRGELAGHPAEFLLARAFPGRNYVPALRRSLDGSMLIVVLDNCIGDTAVPVTLSLNRAEAFELNAPGGDFQAIADALELALPADLRPCPAELTAGVERIEAAQGDADGWARRNWANLSIALPAGFGWTDFGDGEFVAEHPPFDDRDGIEGWQMHFEIEGMQMPQLEGWREGAPDDVVIETLPERDFGPAGIFQQHRILLEPDSDSPVTLLLLIAERPDENGRHPALMLRARGLPSTEVQALSEAILDRIEGGGAR